jgi:hypothetical protein
VLCVRTSDLKVTVCIVVTRQIKAKARDPDRCTSIPTCCAQGIEGAPVVISVGSKDLCREPALVAQVDCDGQLFADVRWMMQLGLSS